MAGQIIDDILDITATQEFLGKPVGGDLRGGIYTLPIIYALVPRSDDLRKCIGAGVDDANLNEARRLIVSSGAIEEARRAAGAREESERCPRRVPVERARDGRSVGVCGRDSLRRMLARLAKFNYGGSRQAWAPG